MSGRASPAPSAAPLLVGDAIDDPHNVAALRDLAALLGWRCAFRATPAAPPELAIGTSELLGAAQPLIVLDNGLGAESLHGFRPAPGGAPTLVVGNERRGVGRDLVAAATQRVEIPMASRRVDTLNVAAAAAVAAHALVRGPGAAARVRADPGRSRPDLLLLGAREHAELGSAIRSAAAFGWTRALVEDRSGVWFGVDRVTRSEGRAAARRGKNAIRLRRVRPGEHLAYEEACVVTLAAEGVPLHRASLARGPRQLVVVPDEGAVDLAAEDLSRLARRVRRVRLGLLPDSTAGPPVRYRFVATIALAEVARQVGVRAARGPRHDRTPRYELTLPAVAPAGGELVSLAELAAY